MTSPSVPRPLPAGAAPAKSEEGGLVPLVPLVPSRESDGFVLEPGRTIAKKYVLDRPAGFGGMAQLWVATNPATGAEVCVKLLVPDPEKGHDEELVARFRREAHAVASLSHRAIVRVFDLLEIDETGAAMKDKTREPYGYAIVMELLRGENLGDVLAKRGKIPTEEALDLFLPVLSALGHAHRAAIIHRDLKPDNIFLATEPDGHVIPKVLDFGVSKLEGGATITIDGVVVGTPSFMSPEQAKGARSIDARSDVFSAGILFYMMVGGRNPFDDGSTFASTVEAVLRREVPPIPELAPEIWSVIERAIRKDPAARFGDATEMSIALRKASGRRSPTESDPNIPLPAVASHSVVEPGSGSGTNEMPASSVLSRPDASDGAARRRRTIVAGIVGACGAVIVAALVTVLSGPRASGTSDVARQESGPSTSAVTVAQGVDTVAESAPADTVAASGPVAPAVTPATSGSVAPPVVPRGRASVQPAGAARSAVAPRRQSAPVRKPGEEPHKARDPGF